MLKFSFTKNNISSLPVPSLNKERNKQKNSRTREMLARKDLCWSVIQTPIWSRNIDSKSNNALTKLRCSLLVFYNYVCSFASYNKTDFCVTGETIAEEQNAALQVLAEELWDVNSGVPCAESRFLSQLSIRLESAGISISSGAQLWAKWTEVYQPLRAAYISVYHTWTWRRETQYVFLISDSVVCGWRVAINIWSCLGRAMSCLGRTPYWSWSRSYIWTPFVHSNHVMPIMSLELCREFSWSRHCRGWTWGSLLGLPFPNSRLEERSFAGLNNNRLTELPFPRPLWRPLWPHKSPKAT